MHSNGLACVLLSLIAVGFSGCPQQSLLTKELRRLATDSGQHSVTLSLNEIR